MNNFDNHIFNLIEDDLYTEEDYQNYIKKLSHNIAEDIDDRVIIDFDKKTAILTTPNYVDNFVYPFVSYFKDYHNKTLPFYSIWTSYDDMLDLSFTTEATYKSDDFENIENLIVFQPFFVSISTLKTLLLSSYEEYENCNIYIISPILKNEVKKSIESTLNPIFKNKINFISYQEDSFLFKKDSQTKVKIEKILNQYNEKIFPEYILNILNDN